MRLFRKGFMTAWWHGWRGEIAMVALVCGLVLVAFPGVVFDGRTFMTGWKAPGVNGFNLAPAGSDIPYDGIRADAGASAWQFDPWAEVTSKAWRDGDVPLWNPNQGMGIPHAAGFQTAVFDPLLALVNVHPTPLTWDFSFFLAFCLGAAAMYLFLRQSGLGRLPSLVGTAVFIWSGFFFRYSNNHFFRSYLYLPLLLLLAQRTLRSRRYLAPVGLGCAVAGNLLVGMPEPSAFVLGALTLYCLFLLFFPPVPIERRAAMLRFAFAAVLGGALAAPLLLPGLEFLRLSFSSHTAEAKLGLLADPPNELLRWLMPYGLGERDGPFAATRDWVGVAATVAVVGALASPRTFRRHGGWFFFLLGAAVLAKGYNFPAVRWAGRLPGLSQAIIPVYAMPIAAFCVATLAAIGVQGLSNRDVSRRSFLVVLGIFLAGLGALLWSDRHLMAALPGAHHLRHLLLAGGALALVTFAFLWRRKGAQAIVAMAVLAELCLLIPRGIQTDRIDAFVRPAWLQYIGTHLKDTHERVMGIDAKLFPNTASAYGLQDIRSLTALYPTRYVTYIKQFIQPEFEDRFIGGPPFGSESRRGETDNNPMFDLTGVRYIVAAGQQPGDLIARDFFAANPPSDSVRPAAFNIAGDLRSVISVRPGAMATIPVPLGATKFAFAAASDPTQPVQPGAGGIDVRVRSSDGEERGPLWSGSLDPRNKGWTDVTVDLPTGTPTVSLVVQPKAGTGGAAGFATLRFSYGGPVPGRQYLHVASSDNAEVYENTQRLPRSLVVHRVEPVENEAAALKYFQSVSTKLPSGALRVKGFDPGREAVVERVSPGPVGRLDGCDAPGRATIRSYEHDRVVLDVDTKCPGLAILTDLYYPGWKARVNGSAAKIYATNIAFRGVLVDAGRSTVVLDYKPKTFRAGVALAIGAALVAGVTALLSVLAAIRKPRVRIDQTTPARDGELNDFGGQTPD